MRPWLSRWQQTSCLQLVSRGPSQRCWTSRHELRKMHARAMIFSKWEATSKIVFQKAEAQCLLSRFTRHKDWRSRLKWTWIWVMFQATVSNRTGQGSHAKSSPRMTCAARSLGTPLTLCLCRANNLRTRNWTISSWASAMLIQIEPTPMPLGPTRGTSEYSNIATRRQIATKRSWSAIIPHARSFSASSTISTTICASTQAKGPLCAPSSKRAAT